MDTLHTNGYIIIPNVISNKNINDVFKSIHNDKVNYYMMKQFIDNIFFKAITSNISIMKEPIYTKFRFSNNNNSTDASTFHGDVYNHSSIHLLPIYTCLCYFDGGDMEIIPGSHLKNTYSSIELFNKKQVIRLNKGDILVFHANIHHRGIKFNQQKNRRLLQVFDVFPDRNTYNSHIDKLIIVTTSESNITQIINKILLNVSKNESIINILNFLHYFLMNNDIQYKISFQDLSPNDKYEKYISYEPANRIYYDDIQKEEPLNINIICDKNATQISPSNYYVNVYLFFICIIMSIVYISQNFLSKN